MTSSMSRVCTNAVTSAAVQRCNAPGPIRSPFACLATVGSYRRRVGWTWRTLPRGLQARLRGRHRSVDETG